MRAAIFPAKTAMEIYQQFKKREVMARTKFKGNFEMSKDCMLGVQVFSRTREETLPTLKKFSKVADKGANL